MEIVERHPGRVAVTRLIMEMIRQSASEMSQEQRERLAHIAGRLVRQGAEGIRMIPNTFAQLARQVPQFAEGIQDAGRNIINAAADGRLNEDGMRSGNRGIVRAAEHPLTDLTGGEDMEIDNGGEPGGETALARAGGGGGPGNPVSKETPVSPYPSLSYGLQETHTTILPYVTWFTVALGNTATVPEQVKIRMNSAWDLFDMTFQSVTPGAAYTAPGFYNDKAGRDGRSALVGYFPKSPAAGANADERPQWRDYWARVYEHYTVLGCEYEIIHHQPGMDYDVLNTTPGDRRYPGEIIVGENFDSYSDTAGATGNVMPLTTLEETMNFKNIRWHKIGVDNLNNGNGTLIVKGRYTPGQVKRNINNDGDVKTWTKTDGSLPNLKDFLTLNYWRHPLSPGTFWNANIQVRLKYIVQFKDLRSMARYPNNLVASTPIAQIISNVFVDDDAIMQTG